MVSVGTGVYISFFPSVEEKQFSSLQTSYDGSLEASYFVLVHWVRSQSVQKFRFSFFCLVAMRSASERLSGRCINHNCFETSCPRRHAQTLVGTTLYSRCMFFHPCVVVRQQCYTHRDRLAELVRLIAMIRSYMRT